MSLTLHLHTFEIKQSCQTYYRHVYALYKIQTGNMLQIRAYEDVKRIYSVVSYRVSVYWIVFSTMVR